MSPRQSISSLQAIQPESACPLCGSTKTTASWKPLKFNYGSGESAAELTVQVPVHRCEACEFQYLDDAAERLKHEAICRHLGVLSPKDIRRIRKHHSMTRAKFSHLTGIGEASLNRWENGLSIQTHAYDRFLRLLERPDNMQELEELICSRNSGQSVSEAEGRFRVLELNDRLLKEKEGFQLHQAA